MERGQAPTLFFPMSWRAIACIIERNLAATLEQSARPATYVSLSVWKIDSNHLAESSNLKLIGLE